MNLVNTFDSFTDAIHILITFTNIYLHGDLVVYEK